MKNLVRNLVRFDLHIPQEIFDKIKKVSADKAVPPRVFGRMLLVEKTREIDGAENETRVS